MTSTLKVGNKALMAINAPVFMPKITYNQIMQQLSKNTDITSIENRLQEEISKFCTQPGAENNFTVEHKLVSYKGNLVLVSEAAVPSCQIEYIKGAKVTKNYTATLFYYVPKGKLGYHVERDADGNQKDFNPGQDRNLISTLPELAPPLKSEWASLKQ